MTRLFISYARKDGKDFSARLKVDVQPHHAWLDESDIELDAWTREIEEAIDGSQAFLAVLTNAYHKSRYTELELIRADRKKKTLIPLRVHAEAETPFLLEAAQHVDFSDPDGREASLRRLHERIRLLNAQPAAAVIEDPLRWTQVLARATRQARRFVREHEGTATALGAFHPDLYVRREQTERELNRFLGGTESTALLIGDSGAGKTNVLCQWILDLVEQGHAVLAYDCGSLPDTNLEGEIARDLSLPAAAGTTAALERMDGEAAAAARSVVIVFDSIGDYRGREREGAPDLLRSITALARRTGERTRIVLSCNTATWNRMQRVAPVESRLFRSSENEPFLQLHAFTPEEFEQAYRRYQAYFHLFSSYEDVPPEVREQLRDPVLLRMTAEACRDVQQPLVVSSPLRIYRRFFDDRVKTAGELALVDRLAEEMMKRQSGTLALTDVVQDDYLGREILSEQPASPYALLLDRGILQEWRGDLRAGMTIRFAHTRIAAYAIARHLWQRSSDVAAAAAALVDRNDRFPLGWDVAKTLLLLSRERAAFIALAQSRDLEERELVVEALVELHHDDSETAYDLLRTLFDQKSEEPRHIAIKAAYNIGPQARDFFLRAAIDGDPSMREALKNTLYLIWRNESPVGRRSVADTLYLIWRYAPGFTHDFLNSLLDEIALKNITKFPAIVEFVLDLTITIYINHCEEKEVIERTAALMHDLSVNRLHLNLFNTGIFGKKFEKLVFRAFARAFSEQILNFALFGHVIPVRTFFELSKEDRAGLARIADFFDPASNLAAAHADLVTMLQSGTPIFAGSATMAIAVHAARDIQATEPFIRKLWGEVGAEGRLWILAGFSVLLKDTPAQWIPLLEDLTRRYVTEHRSSFVGRESRLAADLDIALLPLGLAYGKRGGSMPLYRDLLETSIGAGDTAFASRLIAALGAVGFYYPHAVLDIIRTVADELNEPEMETSLVATLATMRTLHVDTVDRFLNQIGAPDGLRHRVHAEADVGLVHRYIRVLGYYNNAVHFTLYYPRMRKPLSAGALKLLAVADNANQFIADYTVTAMRMLRDSRFQLLEWTLP